MAREQRRLAAIVAADVVGYSRLMGRDESGTLARLKAHRTERLEPALGRHDGRLVKLTGDGALIEFASAVDALGAAIEFQQAMSDVNRDQPEDIRIVFRIGLHLGDLIVDDDDLYGDGVNIAARLEAEAPAGSIVISRAVHEAVDGRLKATFTGLGSLALKNIERHIEAFRVVWDPADWNASLGSAVQPRAPDRHGELHSILVLPFAAGTEPEYQSLAEAITDDLTHDLSRIPGTLVIAHSSALTLRRASIDAQSAAREFAVRYVVDGSVRIGAERIRVNVQLIDAESGGQVWADRIDAPRSELADLQEGISGRIAWALELELPTVESRRGRHGGGSSADAFELSMLGWSLMNRPPTQGNVIAAAEYFQKAATFDANSVHARIGLSFTHIRKVVSFWSESPEEDIARASDLIDPALTQAPRHDRGHFVKGLILRTQDQAEQSSTFFERAIQLNPNYAQAIAFLGYNKTLVGLPEQCFKLIERAVRLSPRDPQLGVWLNFAGVAHSQLRQYDRALEVHARAAAANPEYGIIHYSLAAACVLAGQLDRGVVALENAMRLLPNLTGRAIRRGRQSKHPMYVEANERAVVALQSIGLPD